MAMAVLYVWPGLYVRQLLSKVCDHSNTLLEWVQHCCIANWQSHMTQQVLGDYITNFETPTVGFGCSRACLQFFKSARRSPAVQVQVQSAHLLQFFGRLQKVAVLCSWLLWGASASECTQNRGLLLAQAFLSLTGKAAQPASVCHSVQRL